MNQTHIIVLALLLAGFSSPRGAAFVANGASSQGAIRVAVVGSAGSRAANDFRHSEAALAEALSRDPRISVVDPSIVQSALAGIGYDGSINMNKDEARKLGAVIGCDFFIIEKSEALTRSTHEKESHEEAYAGMMIVDGRSGALGSFDFITRKASTKDAAQQALNSAVDSRVSSYVERMIQIREQALRPRSRDAVAQSSTAADVIEDIPTEGSTRASGFDPPEFINRVKPEYTTEAEAADITATVEAMVIFRSNGEIGGVEIIRWAGFGLDESSERAIRQLKFKPATRDGGPISVRAMIRYNFRRVSDPAAKADQPAAKPPDKPAPDLRQIFKPTFRRP